MKLTIETNDEVLHVEFDRIGGTMVEPDRSAEYQAGFEEAADQSEVATGMMREQLEREIRHGMEVNEKNNTLKSALVGHQNTIASLQKIIVDKQQTIDAQATQLFEMREEIKNSAQGNYNAGRKDGEHTATIRAQERIDELDKHIYNLKTECSRLNGVASIRAAHITDLQRKVRELEHNSQPMAAPAPEWKPNASPPVMESMSPETLAKALETRENLVGRPSGKHVDDGMQ